MKHLRLWIFCFSTSLLVLGIPLEAQVWSIPRRTRELHLDGVLDEWQGIPGITLRPGQTPSQGTFHPNDVSVELKAVWDDECLYLGLEWQDDVWDIREVRRRDSVFVTPDRQRRDRMLFFDYLRFHLSQLNYDYLLWFSPRANEQGPFFWERLLKGKASMEAASSPPVITPRQEDGKVHMELRFYWKELQLKPGRLKKNPMPLSLIVADGDAPDQLLETKLANLKWLEWKGLLQLSKN